MWLETDVGSEQSLTSFDVTHPVLWTVEVYMFWQWLFWCDPDVGETEWERLREVFN